MVDVKSRRCSHEGYSRYARYGVCGTTPNVYCLEHTKEGMVNVRAKRCSREKCITFPSSTLNAVWWASYGGLAYARAPR